MNRISQAYDQIPVDHDMIESTIKKLDGQRNDEEDASSRRFFQARPYRVAVAWCMVLLLVIVSGFRQSVSAASYISIDSDLSIELTLNRWNQVIDVQAFDETGHQVIENIRLKGQNYQKAIAAIDDCEDDLYKKDNGKKHSAQKDDRSVTYTVLSSNEKKYSKIEKGIQTDKEQTKKAKKTTSLYDHAIYEEAHAHGMSFGKYATYLSLKEQNAEAKVEDCKKMTMKELEDCVKNHEELTEETESTEDTQSQDSTTHHSKHSSKDGHGKKDAKKEKKKHHKKNSDKSEENYDNEEQSDDYDDSSSNSPDDEWSDEDVNQGDVYDSEQDADDYEHSQSSNGGTSESHHHGKHHHNSSADNQSDNSGNSGSSGNAANSGGSSNSSSGSSGNSGSSSSGSSSSGSSSSSGGGSSSSGSSSSGNSGSSGSGSSSSGSNSGSGGSASESAEDFE